MAIESAQEENPVAGPPISGPPVAGPPAANAAAITSAAAFPPEPWKPFDVPTEIFGEILKFLTREDAKNMRLVCKRFDHHIASAFFSSIVVPFTAELYAAPKSRIKLNRDEKAQAREKATEKRTDGLRIFESFGKHVNRFALCLELDEEQLANPPIKSTQQIVPAFWGLYRWPKPLYTRYEELEEIEDTADELASMKTALRCLTKVSELGLCCDPGLGYLTGPERNPLFNPGHTPVFRSWNKDHRMDEDPQPGRDWHHIDRLDRSGEPLKPPKFQFIESMAHRSGFLPSEAIEAAKLLLRSENVSMEELEIDDLNLNNSEFTWSMAPNAVAAPVAASAAAPGAAGPAAAPDDAPEAAAADPAPAITPAYLRFRLLPNRLTGPQKEMLLEMEWAHRALIQSYVLAITDLARENHFGFLTTLNIAKIPSTHLTMFKSTGFWDSLKSLSRVSFAVIPEWRTITKNANNAIESLPRSPVPSANEVFALLKEYVGVRPNITYLHFEWLCGGEFAPGSNQRDRFVLPVPFCTFAKMVDPETAKESEHILDLPYIQNLSLKNCYASPHVFMQVIRSMALASLDNLELVSVSLTGPPRKAGKNDFSRLTALLFGHPPLGALNLGLPLGAFGNHVPVAGLAAPNFNPHMTPEEQVLHMISDSQRAVNNPIVLDARWRTPRLFSWSGFIEHFTSGKRVQDALAADGIDVSATFYGDKHTSFLPPPSISKEREGQKYKLRTISFLSCGYVSVKAPNIDTVAVSSLHDLTRRDSIRPESLRDRDLAMFLQGTSDGLAGYIIPDLEAVDCRILEGFHHMTLGWKDVVPTRVIASASADDALGGESRFSGVLGSPNRTASTCHPDYVVRS
ncbi:F-box domain-containing protein [Plectosphaerella plurivora]|uniref:F-box domain-containing protein n=1 Tax=Plectosphaerella plurivora TaxID=936078 RepID=A0A9P8V2S8_9PEZI|nr:F-box domain-containing protein [Plectosphaerella plurivora]